MKRLMNGIKKTMIMAAAFVIAAGFINIKADAAGDTATIEVTKTLNQNQTDNGGYETFHFKLTAISKPTEATILPMPTGATGNAAGDTHDFSVTGITSVADLVKSTSVALDFSVPGVRVGSYQYELMEVPGSTAGMVYDQSIFNIEVVVTNDGAGGYEVNTIVVTRTTSSDGQVIVSPAKLNIEGKVPFENTYNTGSLAVSKTVTGNQGDAGKEFNFTLRIDRATSGALSFISSGGVTIATGDIGDSSYTGTSFTLKHGESLDLSFLPDGTKYEVTESDYATDGYTTSYLVTTNGTAGTATTGRTVSGEVIKTTNQVSFTNDKGYTPPTGITTETMIFGVIIMIAVLGLGVFFIGKAKKASYKHI